MTHTNDYEVPTIDNPPQEFVGRSTIGKAICTWQSGNRISMETAADLMEAGFDVPALEAHHTRYFN